MQVIKRSKLIPLPDVFMNLDTNVEDSLALVILSHFLFNQQLTHSA